MRLLESAQSGGLQSDKLSDALSAVSLAVGQDCRSQLLMQLIILIQQQLAAASTNNTTNPSAVVQPLHNNSSTSVNTGVEDNVLALNTASQLMSDIEKGNTSIDNEMDKLLSWKNRIENASLTSTEQQNGSVYEQRQVLPEPASQRKVPPDPASQRQVLPDPASPDTPAQSCVETDGMLSSDNNTYSFAASSDMPSCTVTDVMQLARCHVASSQLTVTRVSAACSPALTSSSPPVEYPPLPTPPKPPANLLMDVDHRDRRDLGWELPVLPSLDCAVCSSSVTQRISDVYNSASTACRPCLSVPSFMSSDVSSRSATDVPPADCMWPKVLAATTVQSSSHCLMSCASDVLETFCHDTSCEISDSSSMKPLSTRDYVNEAWHSDSTNNRFSQLNTVQEVHEQPHIKSHSVRSAQDLCFQPRRTARLQSPSTWLSRLASPSVFVSQSSASRLHSAVNLHPEAELSSHKLADQLSTSETSHSVHCEQRSAAGPGPQQRSARTVDQRHAAEHTDLFYPSSSEVAGQLNLSTDDRQVRDFDNVSSDSKGCVLESDAEYRSRVTSQLSAAGTQYTDDTLRASTDKVLMRLAGMPGSCDEAVMCETEAAGHDDGIALTAAGDTEREERSSQIADVTAASECGTETCDETTKVFALRPSVDEMTTGNTAGPASPVMFTDELTAVSLEPSQQTTGDYHVEPQQQQQQDVDDDLEEGEIVDDCSPATACSQRELPQATQQLLYFLKTDPVRKSSSSRAAAADTHRRRRDDRREDVDKYRRTNSTSRRRW